MQRRPRRAPHPRANAPIRRGPAVPSCHFVQIAVDKFSHFPTATVNSPHTAVDNRPQSVDDCGRARGRPMTSAWMAAAPPHRRDRPSLHSKIAVLRGLPPQERWQTAQTRDHRGTGFTAGLGSPRDWGHRGTRVTKGLGSPPDGDTRVGRGPTPSKIGATGASGWGLARGRPGWSRGAARCLSGR